MVLEEFMRTDTFKDAEHHEYVDLNGEEIDEDPEELLDVTIMDYYEYAGGRLEITLDM